MLKPRPTFAALLLTFVLFAYPPNAFSSEARPAWIVTGAAFGWASLWAIPFAMAYSRGPYAYEPVCDGVPISNPVDCQGQVSTREKEWVGPLAASSGVCMGAGIVVGFFSLAIVSLETCPRRAGPSQAR